MSLFFLFILSILSSREKTSAQCVFYYHRRCEFIRDVSLGCKSNSLSIPGPTQLHVQSRPWGMSVSGFICRFMHTFLPAFAKLSSLSRRPGNREHWLVSELFFLSFIFLLSPLNFLCKPTIC